MENQKTTLFHIIHYFLICQLFNEIHQSSMPWNELLQITTCPRRSIKWRLEIRIIHKVIIEFIIIHFTWVLFIIIECWFHNCQLRQRNILIRRFITLFHLFLLSHEVRSLFEWNHFEHGLTFIITIIHYILTLHLFYYLFHSLLLFSLTIL